MTVGDRLTGAAFAVALAVQAYAIVDSWGGAYWVFGCVAGAAVCVLALLRRRLWAAGLGLAVAVAAVAVARVAHLPGEPSPAMALGLAVLLGSAIRVRPVRPAALVATGGLAVVAGSWFVTPGVATLNALAWCGAVITGLGLRLLDDRHRAAAEEARRDERLELARELHDVVAHHVTGIVLQAQAARVVRRRHPEALDEHLAGIETAGAEALTGMRQVVGLLRDTGDAVSAAAIPESLGELVGRFDGPAVRLRLPDGGTAWPREVTSTVYRIVQEALTNVARHAPRARSVAVSVAQDREGITVEVVDDGPAARPHRGGYGLVGMRERVEALGGTLFAGPCDGPGWTVRARLPVR
ncbi:sensor histidine kinase [Actinophytocola sp.]|uniref:sensor histidine kinase n=1 Tax=Actinophytocola sp. TaxID=1872138 RepID=UPI00389A8647